MPNAEHVGEAADVFTADHPKRTDSPAYLAARKVLMNQRRGGCVICGGLPDMSHPELYEIGEPKGLEDHHGGGIYVKDVLVGLNLMPIEWSQGWGANAESVARMVANLNVLFSALGEPTYDDPVTDTDSVMAWVDSVYNANVKLCKPHHVGTQHQHTPDVHGHEAVGIHEIPGPIFWGQITCDWPRFDMWGGSTGTVAVAPHTGDDGKPVKGHVVVLHAAESSALNRGDVLPPHHPTARLAHMGAHVDKGSASA